jgi:hypothetical protein
MHIHRVDSCSSAGKRAVESLASSIEASREKADLGFFRAFSQNCSGLT